MAKIPPLAFLPPIIFLGLAGLFYYNLSKGDPRALPSTMIGRDAPALLQTVALRTDPAPTADDLNAPGVKLVNFWASWCVACRAEAEMLDKMDQAGLNIIGIDYKDTPKNAFKFLDEFGDPFSKIAADPTGRTGIEWGVYGVPETFVIDGNGKILLRHPGPITQAILDNELMPLIKSATK